MPSYSIGQAARLLRVSPERVQHASLETHGAVAWFDEDGRLNVRTSSQTPFLTRRALCALYDLPPEQVRVAAGRVGGGFGGKQESSSRTSWPSRCCGCAVR